jgi:hypothetical protein
MLIGGTDVSIETDAYEGEIYGHRRRLGELFGFSMYNLYTSNVSSLTDVNTLVAQLGGNGNVAGFYDRRANVTGNPNVTAWADVRITGVGPTASYASGTNPTVASAGSPVSFTAGGSTLDTTASTWYSATGPTTIVYVGTGILTTATGFTGLVNTGNSVITVSVSGGSLWKGNYGNPATQLTSSAIANATNVYCVVSELDSTGVNATLKPLSNGTLATSAAVTSVSPGTNTVLHMGHDTSGGGTSATTCAISALIICRSVLVSAQWSLIASWANTIHGATLY